MPESMKMYTSMLGQKKSVSVDYVSQMFEETRIYKSPLKMYWNDTEMNLVVKFSIN